MTEGRVEICACRSSVIEHLPLQFGEVLPGILVQRLERQDGGGHIKKLNATVESVASDETEINFTNVVFNL